MKKSQNKKILSFLKSKKSITPIEALNLFGCFRLSGRIYDLRKEGHKIESEIIEKNGKHFSKYSLQK